MSGPGATGNRRSLDQFLSVYCQGLVRVAIAA